MTQVQPDLTPKEFVLVVFVAGDTYVYGPFSSRVAAVNFGVSYCNGWHCEARRMFPPEIA